MISNIKMNLSMKTNTLMVRNQIMVIKWKLEWINLNINSQTIQIKEVIICNTMLIQS